MKKMTIAIIGGTSAFGKWWENYFTNRGYSVIIASRSTEITAEEAVKIADIIIISVSIRATKTCIQNLVPLIPEGKLLMDFTGIKQEAAEELQKYTLGEVVATHPMFGPGITSLKDQNIAFDPIRPGEKWNEIKELWSIDGANLIKLSSRRHDELVSIVQSSVHFINLLLGHLLQKRNISMQDILAISTPNSRMQLMILGRFLNQEASLYSDMQIHNSLYKNEILEELCAHALYLKSSIQSDQSEAFEIEFNTLKSYMGSSFLESSLNLSKEFDERSKTLIH